MPNLKTTIHGLDHCAFNNCVDCPYSRNGCVDRLFHDALSYLEKIIYCKDCAFGKFNGLEYLCEKHSSHKDNLGEDVIYSEWHPDEYFCADAERGKKDA